MAELTFDPYTTSSSGTTFTVMPNSKFFTPALQEDSRVFNKEVYSKEIHGPIPVFSTGDLLEKPYPRCLDLPIRLRGDTTYALPEEWSELLPLVKRIIEFEHANNPSVINDYYTYLTVDSSWQSSGAQQRNGGLHVDGFQGARIQPKTKINRSYVATSNGGTRFYPQTFFTAWNDEIYNLFLGFDQQANEPIIAGENTVWFMDAYTVHESGFALREGQRTFIRLTYDCKEFDRLGNTINAMLDYKWDFVERNAHEALIPPPPLSQQ